jgi:hypothetical protein
MSPTENGMLPPQATSFTERSRRCTATPAAASSRLQQVLDGIDALNRQDPRSTSWQGKDLPYEYAYSCWLTE